MFSDSYIGTVSPQTRTRASYIFQAHNALVTTEDGGSFTTIYAPGCSASNPCSYFVPSNSNNFFWVGDGLVVEPSPGTDQVKMFLTEWTGSGLQNLQYEGSTIVTLALPSLAVESYTPLSLPLGVEWGSAVLRDGSWIYIYGVEDLGGGGKFAHVARTTADALEDPAQWTFWNGAAWVGGAGNSVRMLSDSISNGFSALKINNSYELAGEDTSSAFGTWKDILTYTAAGPQGPWGDRTIVYQTPETGQGQEVTYNPHAHPEFDSNGQMLVSYNTNSLDGTQLTNANLYIPKFIRVPIPALP